MRRGDVKSRIPRNLRMSIFSFLCCCTYFLVAYWLRMLVFSWLCAVLALPMRQQSLLNL